MPPARARAIDTAGGLGRWGHDLDLPSRLGTTVDWTKTAAYGPGRGRTTVGAWFIKASACVRERKNFRLGFTALYQPFIPNIEKITLNGRGPRPKNGALPLIPISLRVSPAGGGGAQIAVQRKNLV